MAAVCIPDIDSPTRQLPGEARWIRWSLNASTLRFTLMPPNSRMSALWGVPASGGNLRRLLPGWDETAAVCCGNWTRDGSYFVSVTRESSAASFENDGWVSPCRAHAVDVQLMAPDVYEHTRSGTGRRLGCRPPPRRRADGGIEMATISRAGAGRAASAGSAAADIRSGWVK